MMNAAAKRKRKRDAQKAYDEAKLEEYINFLASGEVHKGEESSLSDSSSEPSGDASEPSQKKKTSGSPETPHDDSPNDTLTPASEAVHDPATPAVGTGKPAVLGDASEPSQKKKTSGSPETPHDDSPNDTLTPASEAVHDPATPAVGTGKPAVIDYGELPFFRNVSVDRPLRCRTSVVEVDRIELNEESSSDNELESVPASSDTEIQSDSSSSKDGTDEIGDLEAGGEQPASGAPLTEEPISSAASADHCGFFDEPSAQGTLAGDLRKWASDHFVGRNAVHALLGILRNHGHEQDLPKSTKTLLGTPRNTTGLIKTSCGGEFWYGGIVNGIKSRLTSGDFRKIEPQEIVIDVFVDGLSPYTSVKKHLCAIVGSIVGHRTKPFEIALWCGDIHEPNDVHEFFSDFVEEARLLLHEGFVIDDVDGRFSFKIEKFIGDALARAWMMQNVTPPGAFFCCERCTLKGHRLCMRTLFDPQTEGILRTDESLIEQTQAEHHAGVSPLVPLGVKPLSQVPIEPMHNVYLGAFRRIFQFLFTEKKISKIRVRPSVLQELSEHLTSLKVYYPTEYNRKIRPLTQWQKYKASELRRLALYDCFFLLPQLECKTVAKVHRFFGCAIRILSDKDLVTRFCGDADRLLRKFVLKSSELFGELFATFNVHCLTHLADEARRYGALETFSAWQYETHLGQIKKMIRAPGRTLQQIVNRLYERRAEFSSRREARVEDDDIRLSQPHSRGPTIEATAAQQFLKVSVSDLGDFRLNSANDRCFASKNGEVCVVRNITRLNDQVQVICNAFLEKADFFTDPFPSQLLGICKVKKLGPLKTVPISEIKRKIVLLPLKKCDVKENPTRTWMDTIECLCLPMLHHPTHTDDD